VNTNLPFLQQGSLTHHVAEERPGAFILTPRGSSSADWIIFQEVVRDVHTAQRAGLIHCLATHSTDAERVGCDLMFVTVDRQL
jgi:hypothetical protein